MTDMFALLQLPNAGDDLQALKKGITELADIIVVNKADIDEAAATGACAQITSSLRLLGLHGQPEDTPEDATVWHPVVLQVSALTGAGMTEFRAEVSRFRALQTTGGQFARRRQRQNEAWMRDRLEAGLRQRFRAHPAVQAAWPGVLEDVRAGRLAASVAARKLLELVNGRC
jgi:LAO/AO transport system kinase